MERQIIIVQSASNDVHEKLLDGIEYSELRMSPTSFNIERYQSIAAVRGKYPKGLPEQAIIVLNERLRDGSASLILDLFNEKNKKTTFICCWKTASKKMFTDAGFEHITDNVFARDSNPYRLDIFQGVSLVEQVINFIKNSQ